MASSQAVNLAINYGWTLGESGWNLEMDENLLVLDALVLLAVLSATTTAPPGSPSAGDRYIVPTGGTGAWSGHDEEIAQYSGTAWNFYTPQEGWFCRAADTRQTWIFDSSNWVLDCSLYGQYADDTAAATGGVPIDGVYVNSSTGALHARLT